MQGKEDGFAVVWLAITLVVLLGMAAFAVDVTNWHLVQTREQRAVDAAALAGAVKFPGDVTAADLAAMGVADANGYVIPGTQPFGPGGSCTLAPGDETTMCSGPGDRPYQYKVKLVRRVRNTFGAVLGIETTPVGATATAEYLRPLSMGSPSNQFGNDPDVLSSWPMSGPSQEYPNFWANVAGGQSIKQNGDAYTVYRCDIPTDGCNGIGPGQSNDFKPRGYFYAVDFQSNTTTKLQVFDPGFVEVGDYCDGGIANLPGAAALPNVPSYPQGATNVTDIAQRYAPVTNASDQDDPGFQYCTGDQLFSGGPPPDTTYTVLKATVPGDPSSATPVCAPVTYPGYSGDLAAVFGSNFTVPGAPGPLATYFRQWDDLCQVSGNAGEQFFIEVQTDVPSQGHNRFSLRGIKPGGGAADVTIAGAAYMGIYANVGTNVTEFHLVRLPSAAAGHTLVLNFYDIGDAPSGSIGTLTIVPPADSNVGGPFGGCRWTGDGINGATGNGLGKPDPPWGTLTPITDCTITDVNDNHANWNAQWSTVQVPVPTNYTCNDGDPLGCWVKIDYHFSGGVNDTTSWNAFLLGDPVRLVK